MLDNYVRIFDCRVTTYQKFCLVLKHFSFAISDHLLTVIGIRYKNGAVLKKQRHFYLVFNQITSQSLRLGNKVRNHFQHS